ncbi:MAG: hypothetical protein HZC17_01920 [Candidatus Omnitrophica bacterium]|nr:hypothetical protein [Candidatus Omnitrophota bacterium]
MNKNVIRIISFLYLVSLFAFRLERLAFADTDVAVFESKISAASLDASGNIVDEKTVPAGQQVIGIKQGAPVPQPIPLTDKELADGQKEAKELAEKSKLEIVLDMLEELKRKLMQ